MQWKKRHTLTGSSKSPFGRCLSVYSNIKVSDYLQHIAGDNPSFRHMDLADLILESRRHPDTSQNPTFQQIKRYISPEYHSEAEALIEDLGLEFLSINFEPEYEETASHSSK